MSSVRSKYKLKNSITSSKESEGGESIKITQQSQTKISNQKVNTIQENKQNQYQNNQIKNKINYSCNQNQANNINIQKSSVNNFSNSNEIYSGTRSKNLTKSEVAKKVNFRFESNIDKNKSNIKPNKRLTYNESPVFMEIEYEKVNNNNNIANDENGNFNVHYIKYNTLTTPKKVLKQTFRVNPRIKQNLLKQNQNKIINEDNEDENPYKENNNNYNYAKQEQQYQGIKKEAMPLEVIHIINEKKFKAHLVQRLKSFKIKQAEDKKIPLNIASKMRREESIKNSLKHLLIKQSQPRDIKKELMYYKGYFRFWKRKTKLGDESKFRRRIKKDRNIRITTVIYRADIPKRIKKSQMKKIQEQKIQNEKNQIFRQNLINNLEKKIKSKNKDMLNYNQTNNNYVNNKNYNANINNINFTNSINNQNYNPNINNINFTNYINNQNDFGIINNINYINTRNYNANINNTNNIINNKNNIADININIGIAPNNINYRKINKE